MSAENSLEQNIQDSFFMTKFASYIKKPCFYGI